jgi:HD-like signal output (HDOD) protein
MMRTPNNDASVQMARILFVDDETSILNSLQREFFDSGFEVFTAQSARDGLKVLEEESIDLLVSDYRMPGMDGLNLLGIARKNYPATYRVILSGLIDQSAVLKALSTGLASLYISKPWERETLQKEIEHLFLTKRALRNPEILKIVNSVSELPVLPRVYREFAQAAEEGRSYDELARIIKRDVATATSLLRIASSAYYRLDRENLSIERAIAFLGLNALNQMLLFTSLASQEIRDNRLRKHVRDLSIHSILVNYGMSELYKIQLGKPLPEGCTSIGIVHDIGRLIVLAYCPEQFDATVAYMQNHPEEDFYQCETAAGFGGCTHAELGAFFLDLWGFPEVSIEATLHHHNVNTCREHPSEVLRVCQEANDLVNHIAGHPYTTDGEPPACPEKHTGEPMLDLVADLMRKWEEYEASC